MRSPVRSERPRTCTAPSPKVSRSPSWMSVSRLVVVDLDDLGVLAAVPGVRWYSSPSTQGEALLGHVPTRTLGPGRSTMMPIGRPEVGRDPADAVVPLEGQLERLVGEADAGDVHARLDQSLSVASSSEAGPMVAMIFVRRAMGTNATGRRARPGDPR